MRVLLEPVRRQERDWRFDEAVIERTAALEQREELAFGKKVLASLLEYLVLLDVYVVANFDVVVFDSVIEVAQHAYQIAAFLHGNRRRLLFLVYARYF